MTQAHDCYAPLSLRANLQATRRMDVAAFLTPKSEVVWVSASGTVEQALERMKPNGFAAVPIIDDDGCYVGTLSTNDLMWFLLGSGNAWQERTRVTSVMAVPRRPTGLPVHVDTGVATLVARATEQSFIAVVDDRDVFIGIVRRRPLLEYCARLAALPAADVKAFASKAIGK